MYYNTFMFFLCKKEIIPEKDMFSNIIWISRTIKQKIEDEIKKEMLLNVF